MSPPLLLLVVVVVVVVVVACCHTFVLNRFVRRARGVVLQFSNRPKNDGAEKDKRAPREGTRVWGVRAS